jgi:hypothetical protein
MPETKTSSSPGDHAETPTPATEVKVDASSAETARQQRLAQIAAERKQLDAQSARKETTTETGKALWTPDLAKTMSAGIFVFAVLLFAMVTILVWKNKSIDNLLRTFGILLIIIAAVFLVIAGYSDQQIAPVMGLLGTIAGYLLSRKNEPGTGVNSTTLKAKPTETDAPPSA